MLFKGMTHESGVLLKYRCCECIVNRYDFMWYAYLQWWMAFACNAWCTAMQQLKFNLILSNKWKLYKIYILSPKKCSNLQSILSMPGCAKTHLQPCRNSKIFRGKNPRTPTLQGQPRLTRRGRGAPNAGRGGGWGRERGNGEGRERGGRRGGGGGENFVQW